MNVTDRQRKMANNHDGSGAGLENFPPYPSYLGYLSQAKLKGGGGTLAGLWFYDLMVKSPSSKDLRMIVG